MAQAQVQVAPQVQAQQKAEDFLSRLDEASLKQGIELDFKAPSPVGGGRRIDREGAAKLFSEGRQVLVAEVTNSDGPVRSHRPTSQVRREVYLTGTGDLESYTRYFTQARPQNDTERAAQQLKKFVYGQGELITLQRPGQNPERPTLSPFAAAQRLDKHLKVNVRTEADGVIRTQPQEVTLNRLGDLGSVLGLSSSVSEVMQQLDDASLVQGIELEYQAPSPVGGGRLLSQADAADKISQGERVLISEVTSSTGPSRGQESVSQVRRETYLSGAQDLESYARYFTNAEPRNETEQAAQKLKKYVYGQMQLTTLMSPDQPADLPTLSPFAAARRLAGELPVTVRVAPDGVIRTEPVEIELNNLQDAALVTFSQRQ
jgi:cell fate (sporulation/competence/biofilm development) regulator YlbF (YheA/YmcA/DUF963 family)